ncbi:MAG: hypothetical protein FD123_1739 [Bacteroidetes bacterium]|nr:MAG: hypothetical protein FD123_1739 [Bacteroidota bacterium]
MFQNARAITGFVFLLTGGWEGLIGEKKDAPFYRTIFPVRDAANYCRVEEIISGCSA